LTFPERDKGVLIDSEEWRKPTFLCNKQGDHTWNKKKEAKGYQKRGVVKRRGITGKLAYRSGKGGCVKNLVLTKARQRVSPSRSRETRWEKKERKKKRGSTIVAAERERGKKPQTRQEAQ